MNTIKIRQYTPTQLKFYGPDDKFIGFVNNEIESIRVRIDIANNKISGYYFMYCSKRINILPDGSVDNWPDGLYNESLKLALELASIQSKNK